MQIKVTAGPAGLRIVERYLKEVAVQAFQVSHSTGKAMDVAVCRAVATPGIAIRACCQSLCRHEARRGWDDQAL